MHGDLHPPHILVDGDSRLVGLLDWTEGQAADAAMDFSLICGIMGGDVVDRLLTRYEQAGGYVWPRMRAHIVERWFAYPSVIAAFAMRSGNDEYLNLARAVMTANEQASA